MNIHYISFSSTKIQESLRYYFNIHYSSFSSTKIQESFRHLSNTSISDLHVYLLMRDSRPGSGCWLLKRQRKGKRIKFDTIKYLSDGNSLLCLSVPNRSFTSILFLHCIKTVLHFSFNWNQPSSNLTQENLMEPGSHVCDWSRKFLNVS